MCFLCYFLHNAKSNIPSPFRELSIAWKACPCRGCTPRVQGSFEVLQTSIQRTQVAVSHKLIKSLPLRGISSGRRGAAPYLYTQSVYKYATLRVYLLASQAFSGGQAAGLPLHGSS